MTRSPGTSKKTVSMKSWRMLLKTNTLARWPPLNLRSTESIGRVRKWRQDKRSLSLAYAPFSIDCGWLRARAVVISILIKCRHTLIAFAGGRPDLVHWGFLRMWTAARWSDGLSRTFGRYTATFSQEIGVNTIRLTRWRPDAQAFPSPAVCSMFRTFQG